MDKEQHQKVTAFLQTILVENEKLGALNLVVLPLLILAMRLGEPSREVAIVGFAAQAALAVSAIGYGVIIVYTHKYIRRMMRISAFGIRGLREGRRRWPMPNARAADPLAFFDSLKPWRSLAYYPQLLMIGLSIAFFAAFQIERLTVTGIAAPPSGGAETQP